MFEGEKYYQILVIGEAKVGKTQFINQAVGLEFTEIYTPTLFNVSVTHAITLSIKGTETTLCFKEANFQTLNLVNESYYPQIDLILFFFDITSQPSFDKVELYVQKILPKLNGKNPMMLMIGSKKDLYEQRAISYEKQAQFNASVQVSALYGVNIQETFKWIQDYAEPLTIFYNKAKLIGFHPSPIKPKPDKVLVQAQLQFSAAIPIQIKKLQKSLIKGEDKIKQIVRIMVIGQSKVGKSYIVSRMLQQSKFKPMGICLEQKQLSIRLNNQDFRLQVFDTSGSNDFPTYFHQYIKKMQILFLVFDLCDLASFQTIKQLYNDYTKILNIQKVTIVILANKTDLPCIHRKVSFEQGQKLAEEWKSKYYEVCARKNEGVLQAFLFTVQDYLLKKYPTDK